MVRKKGEQVEAVAEASSVLGRPSKYTPELARKICVELAQGAFLRQICRREDFPSEATVRGWVVDDRDGFSAQYARARAMGLHSMAEETVEIADDGLNDTYKKEDGSDAVNTDVVQRSKLRVDTRRWLLSKMLPKEFGDKITQEHTGADGGPIRTESNVTTQDLAKLTDDELAKLYAEKVEPS